LEKTHDALGRPRYELPPDRERRRPDPRTALNAVLAQFGRQATAAQNIVVVQSELGTAPAIARALDRTTHPRVVGTLAGHDTVLVVVRDASVGVSSTSISSQNATIVRECAWRAATASPSSVLDVACASSASARLIGSSRSSGAPESAGPRCHTAMKCGTRSSRFHGGDAS